MKKNRSIVPIAVKVFLALASVTGTIGLWNFLSNRDYSANQVIDKSSQNVPDLPPIPTLVPLIHVDYGLSSLQPTIQPQTGEMLRKVQIAQSAASDQNQPSVNNSPEVFPAPVTSTRSSR